MDKEKTIVIFRVWEWGTGKGNVIALFPDDDAGYGLCSSYMHVGQHGAADYQHVTQKTRPAAPREYKELRAELKQIGYNLTIRKRRPVR